MKLSEFLKEVNGSVSGLAVWSEKKSLEAVKRNGYALRYVKVSIFEADIVVKVED